MKLKTIIKIAAGYTVAAYVYDVVIKPQLIANKAINDARKSGKPVINVGAGTPGSSLRSALLGPTLWGDVNVDIAAPRIQPGSNIVSYGDAHKIDYPNRHFGSLIASHVLEHMDDPERAIREFSRVSDNVYIIVPTWWAPHTWLHPGHKWFIKGNNATPLWRNNRHRTRLPQDVDFRRAIPTRNQFGNYEIQLAK